MSIRTESLSLKGFEHTVCQDASAFSPEAVVVADGCSSGDNTEFGAQVVARAILAAGGTATTKGSLMQLRETLQGLYRDLIAPGRLAGLNATSFLATGVYADAHNTVFYGDGVSIHVFADNSFVVTWLEFEGNKPSYPWYTCEESGIADVGGTIRRPYTIWNYDGVTKKVSKIETSGYPCVIPHSQFKRPLKGVIVATDGLLCTTIRKNGVWSQLTKDSDGGTTPDWDALMSVEFLGRFFYKIPYTLEVWARRNIGEDMAEADGGTRKRMTASIRHADDLSLGLILFPKSENES